ncbi:hypothetical protein SAMD00019534_112060, partial [Acytostelium subglobosum LB1]|uniref:hypothetical protein n=1 Tax=Acytostelium subglobosum LB1 TaxID=1410327 RepID=UPI000644CEC4
MMEDYQKVYTQTSISDIIKKETLIAVEKTATVQELLAVLHKHCLTSVPVVDSDTGKNRVIGFVDTNDVLALLVKICENASVCHHAMRLLSIGFLHTTVSNIMDLSKKDQFTVVLEEQSLFEVMKMYARGVYRVALLSIFSDIEDIVSQSAVISFIADNVSVLGTLKNKTILDLLPQLVDKADVISTQASTLVYDTFKSMHHHGVTAVPVLSDQTGQIIGTLSINDLSSLKEDNMDLLLQSTERFISRNDMLDPNKHKPSYPIIISVKDTLTHAIEMLAKYKIHRLWIVDEHRKPISILSLTDVCKIITEPPAELKA